MRNKKGDLALSTNAIVVLIIAITILGLALAFTRNIFGTLGENVAAIGQGSLLEVPPTYDDPMTLSRTDVDVRLGSDVRLKIGFFNKYTAPVTAQVQVVGCYLIEKKTEGQFEFTIPAAREVPVNKDIVYSIIVKAKKADPTADIGTHVCTFMIEGEDGDKLYEDLYINVE